MHHSDLASAGKDLLGYKFGMIDVHATSTKQNSRHCIPCIPLRACTVHTTPALQLVYQLSSSFRWRLIYYFCKTEAVFFTHSNDVLMSLAIPQHSKTMFKMGFVTCQTLPQMQIILI